MKKANKLTDAFYFYADRFALAFKNNKFYFMDKNGDKVARLDTWDKIGQFEQITGFAKGEKMVESKIKHYPLDTSGINFSRFNAYSAKMNHYLLDTLGQKYRLAFDVKDLHDSITALDLSQQGLKVIPQEVFQHTQLKILILNHNEISNIPKEIEELKNLLVLHLANNQLKSLPSQIAELKNLTTLNLGNNYLVGVFKQIKDWEQELEMAQIQAIYEVNINHAISTNNPAYALREAEAEYTMQTNLLLEKLDSLKKLGGGLPEEIWQLKNLTWLNLSNNYLDILPPQIEMLKNLTYLDFNKNSIINLPPQIGKLKNLGYLNLVDNFIIKTEQQKIRQLLPNCNIKF